jgi:hypothetical protein
LADFTAACANKILKLLVFAAVLAKMVKIAVRRRLTVLAASGSFSFKAL